MQHIRFQNILNDPRNLVWIECNSTLWPMGIMHAVVTPQALLWIMSCFHTLYEALLKPTLNPKYQTLLESKEIRITRSPIMIMSDEAIRIRLDGARYKRENLLDWSSGQISSFVTNSKQYRQFPVDNYSINIEQCAELLEYVWRTVRWYQNTRDIGCIFLHKHKYSKTLKFNRCILKAFGTESIIFYEFCCGCSFFMFWWGSWENTISMQ